MIVTMMDMKKVAQTGPVYNPRIFGPNITIILSNQCPENKKKKKKKNIWAILIWKYQLKKKPLPGSFQFNLNSK